MTTETNPSSDSTGRATGDRVIATSSECREVSAPPQNPPDKLRIAFLSSGDPRDVREWSGIPHHMLKAVEKQFDVVIVIARPWARWYRPVGRAVKLLSGRRFEYAYNPAFVRLATRKTIKALVAANPDFVLAVSASPIVHQLVEMFRVIHVADATVRQMIGYYDEFSVIDRAALKSADEQEGRILRSTCLNLFPSSWARHSALSDYAASSQTTLEIPWGANLASPVSALPRKLGKQIRLLFVGAFWERKGGQIAVDTLTELNRRGIDCRLDIIGCNDGEVTGTVPNNVVFHGFVSKSSPEGCTLIEQLYRDATLFFLPTKAECYGIVFAEAAHHGLPVVSHATGGIPSVVENGVTGILLEPNSDQMAFADAIQKVTADALRYETMSKAALSAAALRLNWDSWAASVDRSLRTL